MAEDDDDRPPLPPAFANNEEAEAWVRDWIARNPKRARKISWRGWLSALGRDALAAELGLDPARLTRDDRKRIHDLRCDRAGRRLGLSPERIEHMKKANLPWPAEPGFYHPRRRPPSRPPEPLPLPPDLPADPTVPQIVRFLENRLVQLMLAEGFTLEEIAAAFETADREAARAFEEDD
jgi:hypothetical protein